jgi:hypothetical protein
MTGFSGISSNDLWYKKVGKTVFVNFNVQGNGNGAGPLTLPLPVASYAYGPVTRTIIHTMCNGVYSAGVAEISVGSSQITCYFDAGWTGFNPVYISSVYGWVEYQANS